MNHIKQKNRLEKQMHLYVSFLPLCEDNQQLFKLLDEINFLKYQVGKIERMTMSEAYEQLKTITVEFESKDS